MKNIFSRIAHEKVKFALVAISFVVLATFVVLPLLPQVQSSLDTVALKAASIFAFSDGGGGETGGEAGGGSDCGGCGDPGGTTDPGTDQNPPYEPPPPPTPSCTLSANPQSFSAGGGTTRLSWTTDNAYYVSINQGIGRVSSDSSKYVTVGETKTFTLTATGDGGTVTCDTTVTVAPPSAPSCTISANPNNLPYGGGNTTLSWSSQNATAASINQNIGTVGTNGSRTVSTATAKTYTLTVTGPGGTATCDTSVTIAQPSAPACTFSISPENFPYGGGTAYFTWTTDNATSVTIDGGVGGVALDGSKNVPVTTSKTYTLTATGPGGNVTCADSVTVAAPSAPSCTISANPNNLPYGGGNTTLTWTSQNATAATINQYVGSVSVNGSKNVTTQTAKTYVLTVTGPGGSATCEAPVTIAAPSAPTCTLTASPTQHPYGGGTSVLTWTTDNATSIGFNNGVSAYALDGSKSVFVDTSKTYVLTATGPGGTATCEAPVVVAPQPLPVCTLAASPENFPYGGGNTTFTWTTQYADTVSIDQGVGAVTKSGSKNVFVPVTKTFTLTATNPSGSVTCTKPITVGAPNQPTCALTVAPSEIASGGQARVEWSSTNVTSVVIKKVAAGVESPFQNTTASQGSVIVSPTQQTTYKGTFTGPGGVVSCEATLAITAPNAPTCAISASPNTFPYGGGNTTLTWTSQNATNASISEGVGTVAVNGSKNVVVQTGKTYTLTVTGPGGNATCSAPVTVGAPQGPTCELAITPDNHPYGGGNSTLTWNTENASSVSIDQGVGTVALDGSKNVVVSTAKTFKLTATGPGGTVYCEKAVTISAPSAPSCTITASPNNFPYGGGTTLLSWTSQNATNASISEGVGTVSLNGSKYTAVNTAKTFTLTVTGPGGNATCSAPVTISAPEEPSCSLVASPNTHPFGGGNSVLSWTTDNATSVAIDQGVGVVTLDGSKSVVVPVSKVYTLTATGPGGTKVCTAPVTVAAKPLPSCSFTASPNNFPYGGGTTALTWNTAHANTVSIDQGVGVVGTQGVQNATVTATKTYTLTATNETGSVTCVAPVTVGAPSQPTCALTVDPTEILSGNNARVQWSSTNVTSVVIKKFVGGSDEGTLTSTDAGSGSVVVSPLATTTYKGTFTGPGGVVSCEAQLKVKAEKPALTCDAFSASPSVVDRNDSTTLTWNTSNADSVSIDEGVGSVPVDGSRSVKVTDDTTYTLTATRNGETVTCRTSVDVRSSGGGSSPSPRCDLFKASDTRIKEGETVDLRWETTRGTKLEIEPNVFETSDDDEVDEGEVTVKPKKDTKYTLTVWKGSKKDTCTVKVNVDDAPIVLSARDQMPLTSISFTDIPYTGFDAGPFLTSMFYTLLALWSLAIAYLLVVKRGVFGFSTGTKLSDGHGGGAMIPTHEYEAQVDAHAHTAPVHHEPEVFTAHAPMAHAPVSAPAHEQIHVSARAEAPVNLPTAMMPAYAHTVVSGAHPVAHDEVEEDEETYEDEEMDIVGHLENRAHKHNVLLSSDALRMVIDHAGSTAGREALLEDIIERAKAAYPREDGWIVLNRERVNALFVEKHEPTVVAPVVLPAEATPVTQKAEGSATLAEAIVTGNTTLAYQMLGTSPLLAIADAAEALDTVIRARKDGSVIVGDMLVRAAAHVSDEKLKLAVAALVSAIDGTYADENAAVRLAVIKALKAVS